MKANKKLIIIDCSIIAIFAPHFDVKNINSANEYGPQKKYQFDQFINYLENIKKEIDLDKDNVVCVFDGENLSYRDVLYIAPSEQQKIQSTVKIEEYRFYIKGILNGIQAIRDYIVFLGFKELVFKKYRAIDVIPRVVQLSEEQGSKIVVSTCDKSLFRLISSKTSIKDSLTNILFDQDNFASIYEVEPKNICDYLCVVGDPQGGFPKFVSAKNSQVKKLIIEYGSLKRILHVSKNLTGKLNSEIYEKRKFFKGMISSLSSQEENFLLDVNFRVEDFEVKASIFEKSNYLEFLKKYSPIKQCIEYFDAEFNTWLNSQKDNSKIIRSNRHIQDNEYVVYRISNTATGNVYFGSTANVNRRFKDHTRRLENNTHPNPKMRSDCEINGINSFVFKIISRHSNIREMLYREQLYIAMFYGRSNCYNYRCYVEMNESLPFIVGLTASRGKNQLLTNRNVRLLWAKMVTTSYISVHAAKKDLKISKLEISKGLRSQHTIVNDRAYMTYVHKNPNKTVK